MQQWICSKLTFCCLVVEVIEFAISWCERLLCPTDLWICRNILEIESQKENNNQKHWTVKYVLPFQWLQVARSCACRSTGATSSIFFCFLFFVPKGFNWEAGPHWTWTLWRPPVGPGPRHWHWYCPTQSYKAATWWHDLSHHFKLNPADCGRYQGRFKLHASVSTATLKPANFQVVACFWVARLSGGTYHMPKPVAVPGWAIVRFQSRSALWTSWPAGAVERVRRRQFVIKSQVHGHEQN